MELTTADFERVPRENLRVAWDEFVAAWALAERMADAGSLYALGVARTCRWIGHAEWPDEILVTRTERAWPPITHQQILATPDTIEAETVKAAVWYAREDREGHWEPGLLEGIAETFHWVWWESGYPPLDIREAAG